MKFETSGDTTSLILDFKRFAQKYNLIIKMVKGSILLVFAFVIHMFKFFISELEIRHRFCTVCVDRRVPRCSIKIEISF